MKLSSYSLSVLAALTLSGAALAAVVPGFDSNFLPANDDGSTGLVSIGFPQPINFFGTSYSQLYVNNNGNVTFDAPLSTFTPFGLSGTNTKIIAAFFADVDTRGVGSGLTRYGNGVVDGRTAFGVSWRDVGYFANHVDKLNTFQLLLIDRSDIAAGDFDIRFNYDKIEWETGDASGGVGGLGGTPAAAGYSNGLSGGSNVSFELPGSRVRGSFLDASTSAPGLRFSSNSGAAGVYSFAVRNGVVSPVIPEPSTLLFGAGVLLAGLGGHRSRKPRR